MLWCLPRRRCATRRCLLQWTLWDYFCWHKPIPKFHSDDSLVLRSRDSCSSDSCLAHFDWSKFSNLKEMGQSSTNQMSLFLGCSFPWSRNDLYSSSSCLNTLLLLTYNMGFFRFGYDHMVIACTHSYIEIQTLCDLNQNFNLKERKAFFKALVWEFRCGLHGWFLYWTSS